MPSIQCRHCGPNRDALTEAPMPGMGRAYHRRNLRALLARVAGGADLSHQSREPASLRPRR